MKLWLTLLLTMIWGPTWATPMLTVEEILGRYSESQIETDYLGSILSMRIAGDIEFARGERARTLVVKKRPNKVRTTLTYSNGAQVVQGFDGKKTWIHKPEECIRELRPGDASALIRNAEMFNPLAEIRNTEVQVDLLGEGYVKMTPCYHLLVRYANSDHTVEYFLNKKTFHEEMISYEDRHDKSKTINIYFSDFRKVGPITQAHKLETFSNGKKVNTLTIDSLSFNIGVIDEYFEAPGYLKDR